MFVVKLYIKTSLLYHSGIYLTRYGTITSTLFPGSSYNPTDCTTSGQVEGTVCTASCNAGFYHDGGTAAIKCTDTGDWDSTDYMLCGGGCPKLAPIDRKYMLCGGGCPKLAPIDRKNMLCGGGCPKLAPIDHKYMLCWEG